MVKGKVCSADERRRERLPAGEASVLVVPELHGRLAQPPAEQHPPAIELARKVDEADAPVLELDAKRLELRLERVDLARDVLRAALERDDPRVGKIGARLDDQHVELGDRLLPPLMLSHDILDDAADEREGSVGVIDREELHVPESN